LTDHSTNSYTLRTTDRLHWASKLARISPCRHFATSGGNFILMGNSRATVDDTNQSVLTVFFTDINVLCNLQQTNPCVVSSPLCEKISIFHTYIELCTNLVWRVRL